MSSRHSRAASRRVSAAAGVLGVIAALAAAPAPAVAADTVPIEIFVGPQGQFLPVIDVSVNGSESLRMLADTGSNILVTFPGALATATTPPVDTGIAHTANYTGTQASGEVATASVTVGGHTTPQPVAFLDASSCTPTCLGAGIGADLDGILGIGQAQLSLTSGVDTYDLYSVLAQLGGPIAEGYTMMLTPTGGSLEFGAPTPGAGDIVIPQALATGTYGNGWPIHEKRVDLCFRIDTATQCLGTTVDSGELSATLMGTQFLPWVDLFTHPVHVPGVDITHEGTVLAGTPISYLTPDGQPIAAWTTADNPFEAGYYSTTGVPYLNTGNGFFLGRDVGFDFRRGLLVIPGSAPTLASTGAPAPGGTGLAVGLAILGAGLAVIGARVLAVERAARGR